MTSDEGEDYSKGTIAFCTRVATIFNGDEEVSFRKTNYVLWYDLTSIAFGMIFSITADEMESNNKVLATNYVVTACECDESFNCVVEQSPVTQNNEFVLCLDTNDENVRVSNFDLSFSKGSFSYNPVSMGSSSWDVNDGSFTEVTTLNNIVMIRAFLFAGLFEGEGNVITANGEADLTFNSGEKDNNKAKFNLTINIGEDEKEDMMFFDVNLCF